MANHKSAFKRIRQNKVRNERNRATRSRVRTYSKKVRMAIEAGDLETAQADLKLAAKELDKAATKGVLKKNTASRSVARLIKAVHKLSVGA